MAEAFTLSKDALRATVHLRHGNLATAGWGVRFRDRHDYFNPDVYYETAVRQLVPDGGAWIEIGGGNAIFPSNKKLSAELAARCRRLVGVDPSKNIHVNPYVHEKVQAFLEDYQSNESFDLATARMVVEHVAKPREFVASLARLVKPGGMAVILTVDKWAPITVVSHLTPFWFHVKVKEILWGAEEDDTFPTVYKMNTRETLRQLMQDAGFEERAFFRLDDCRSFVRWKWAHWLEVTLWRLLRSIGLGYPEQNLMGIYRRK